MQRAPHCAVHAFSVRLKHLDAGAEIGELISYTPFTSSQLMAGNLSAVLIRFELAPRYVAGVRLEARDALSPRLFVLASMPSRVATVR